MSISTPLTALLGITHPILSAPMDTIAGARLATAVSAAGGFGILGGGYGIDDFDIKDVAFLYAAFGPIHERIKDVPDGTQIEFKIVD